MAEVVPVRDIAIAVTIHRVIPEIADLKLESMVPLGASYEDQNKVLDRMNRLLLRQIAIHSIDKLRDDLAKMQRQKEVAFQNLVDNRKLWQEQLAAKKRELEEAEGVYAAAYKRLEFDWRGRGKQAPFTPASHPSAKSELEQLTAQQNTIIDQIRAKEQEVEGNEESHRRNIPLFNDAIAKAEAELALAEARIAGTDE